ncbi:hypothetical protein N7478_003780 [Penicillium angulare]|uniref:uncharacterized protein n=1 Tax=Penicillium angulare TaxID=116970 RepID=UPI002540AB32|nr:uncharacterized protein N7478_003780 [Penicillium angulare]KAJ5288094.1 hypothetical protein N7478_003780 [Penicillium angulare]
MAPNNDLMAIVDKWLTGQTNLDFEIEFNDVAEYVNVSLCSVHGARVKEEICSILDASLLDAPQSVIEKLHEKAEVQEQKYVKVIILLIVNGFLPPAHLRRPIFGIFLTEQGADLTNHLLEFPSAVVDRFRENLTLLLEFM